MLPENKDEKELVKLGNSMAPCLIGYMAAGYFLSRAYIVHLYILLAIAACIYRLTGQAMGFHHLNRECSFDKDQGWKYPAFAIGSIFVIYIMILIFNKLS